MEFSEKLKELLQGAEMSQRKLAEKIGVSSALMSYYMKGEKSPTMSTIIKIADFFNISMDELVGRKITNSDTGLLLDEEKKLIQSFRKLNNLGQQEVIKRIEELNCMEKYKLEEKESKKIVFATYGGNGVEYREIEGEQAERVEELLNKLAVGSNNSNNKPKTESEKRVQELLDKLMRGNE